MEWQAWAGRLTEVLGLATAPVAVTYTDRPPAEASSQKCRVCGALKGAAEGAIIALSKDNSTCPGGSMYLGLAPQPPERARALREFLINGEKLFSCPTAIHRSAFLSKVKPPFGLADSVVFSPLAKAALPPDIAVFVVNAQQAARLVALAYHETGMPMSCDPTGAQCKSVITYPLVTNQVNVSFGDITARRSEKYRDDELFVTLPMTHLRSAVASIERCSAGTAKIEIPAAMRMVLEETGGEVTEL
jgi:uncharacterized protein (DUF169 family)